MTISAADGEVMADGSARARPLLGAAWNRSSWPWRVAAISAAVLGVAMATLGHVPPPSGLAVAVLVPPALIDVHYRRLPNRWVAAAAVTFLATAALQLVLGSSIDLSGAALGAFVVACPMLVLHLVSPMSMGFGDIKAGIVLGACLGAIGWELALAGLALAAGATSISAIVRGRSVVAFGPGLVAGTLIALAAHTTFVVAPIEPQLGAPARAPIDVAPLVVAPVLVAPVLVAPVLVAPILVAQVEPPVGSPSRVPGPTLALPAPQPVSLGLTSGGDIPDSAGDHP